MGRLTRVSDSEKRTMSGNKYGLYLCRCMNVKEIVDSNVRNGHTKSCGCLLSETSRLPKNITHGKSYSSIYSRWRGMINRCTNPNNRKYPLYGGRGITVCDEWMTFENFYRDMGDPERGTSIDRIDNNKGYFKENCRWATIVEQNTNRRGTLFNKDSVRYIRKKYAEDKNTYSTKWLANKFNASIRAIRHILNRTRWSHIK
jgi:hypothetical protein